MKPADSPVLPPEEPRTEDELLTQAREIILENLEALLELAK